MNKEKSVFSTIVKTINIVRWVISTSLFFGLLAVVVGTVLFVFVAMQPKSVANGSTLILDLNGSVVEKKSTDGVTQTIMQLAGSGKAPETQLFDIVLALGLAKDDPRIDRLVIKTDGLEKMGMAQAREINRAVSEFKKSKKPVYAYGSSFTQKQYLIASNADELYMDPEGSVTIEGLSQYRQYYREALQDKLGINIQLFKVGEFKSAAEPYVLDAASVYSKESDLFWMNDIWNRYLTDVSKNLNVSLSKIQSFVDNYEKNVLIEKGNLAEMALKQKLVSGLMTSEDFGTLIKVLSNSKENPPTIGVSDYILTTYNPYNKEKIAIVVAEGEIVDGSGSAGQVGGDTTSQELARVREDDNVRAVVLRVNSPGGSVFASEQIRREIDLLKQKNVPVVVSMGDTAASGGYWISMNADKIFADESTITGSIGIFGMVPDISKALKKIGVNTDGVATTPFAGSNDITRPLTTSASRMMQSVIDNGYDKFITKISIARQMKVEDVDAVARGRVWSGLQAKERHLIDSFGGLQDAIVYAKKASAISGRYSVVVYSGQSQGGNWMDQAIKTKIVSSLGSEMGVWKILSAATPTRVQDDFEWVADAVRKKEPKVYAHCLCSLDE